MEASQERRREGGRRRSRKNTEEDEEGKTLECCATTPSTGAGLLLRSWMNEVRAPHEIAQRMDEWMDGCGHCQGCLYHEP